MPYYISGEVAEEDIVFNSAEDLKEKYDLEIYLKTEVIEIHTQKNQIQVVETSKGTMFNISYDYLVLSVGSIAKRLKEFENLGDNIFVHKNLRNAKRLKRFIERNEPRNVLIVGSRSNFIRTFRKFKQDWNRCIYIRKRRCTYT